MSSIFQRFVNWWGGLEKSQKPIWIFGGVLMVALVIGAVMIAGRPQMSLLFGGLSPADQGMVVEELGKLGIRAEADTSGNVYVPSSKMAESRMRLATSKKLPNSGNTGLSILDGLSMTASPAVEKEKVRLALESDLANSIRTMQGISGARVHLTLGEDSPFLREVKPASASIILTEDGAGKLRPDNAEAIARLVQYSVTGLTAERIAISNEKGQLLYDGAETAVAGGIADKRLQTEIEEAKRRERDLQQKLDAAFGQGNTVVSIPLLKMNFDQEKTFSVNRDPSKKPTVKEAVKESMSDGVNATEGGAGTEQNIVANSNPNSDPRKYQGENTREEYVINEVERQIQRDTGDLESMSINVLVNSSKITDMAPVQQYITGYLGPLAQSPDAFRTNVTAVAFDTEAMTKQKTAEAAATSRDRMQQVMSLLPIAALIIIGFLVLKTLGKATQKWAPAHSERALVTPEGLTVNIDPAAIRALNDPAVQSLPEVVLQQMTPEQVIEFQQTGELADSLRELAASMNKQNQVVAIEQIPERVHIPLEQIKKMANDKPEAVANLLKSWILEDRK